jgi:hypothetical protein
MTDREKSEPGFLEPGFLERWSRKKIEAEREAAVPAPAPMEPATTDVAETPAPVQGAAKTEFDLAKLPSLDSIVAGTDIRAFLSPGVPKDIARAALRRAWTADPAIRDFKGLAENDWDFTDPTAMPGFGALPLGFDVKKLVAQIFGDEDKPAAPSPIAAASSEAAPQPEPMPASSIAAEPLSSLPQMAEAELVHRTDDPAAQHRVADDGSEEDAPPRPTHGGALPR